jgi:sigma-E factor negative regulatory protein RseA
MNPETAAIAKRGTAMSREALHESLSAVMDNEADELELRRVLSAESDSEMRSTWSRYQIARAAMHKELIEPRLDIASAVSAALAEEPEIPAVKPLRFAWRN